MSSTAILTRPPGPNAATPAACGPDLARIADELLEPRQAIERVFLEMGQQLLASTRLLSEISAAHDGMPGELQSTEFEKAAATLSAIREEVVRMASARSGEDASLRELTAKARAVASPLSDLKKAVRTIRLVAVNARIAAAPISGVEGELGAFTTDMMELGQGVERVVAAFAEAYDGFARRLAEARGASRAFAERHGATMARISERLADHLERVAAHRTRAATTAGEHTALTAQIRTRIGAAVAALQIGDITRQRVEHVEQALVRLADHAQAADEPSAHHTIGMACHLVAAQLDDARGDFEARIIELARSLDELAGDAAAALAAGSREAGATLSDGDAALGAMIGDLGEIRALFRDFADTRAGTEKIAGEVAHAVAVMVDRLAAVEGIEQQIRLLSLNTSIQCGRLGEEGRALRVIAQDMRDIAGETVAAAGAILGALEGAEDISRALVEGESADLARRIAALEAEATTATDLFGAVSARLRGHVGTMSAVGPRAVSQLQAAAVHAKTRRGLAASWQQAAMRIRALAHFAAEECDPALLDTAFFAVLRAAYTMDDERQLHDALLGLPHGKDVEMETTEREEPELDDIFL